jgi:MFS family permease
MGFLTPRPDASVADETMAGVLDNYRHILSYPGAFAFASSGLLSRIPIAMYNISFILMVQIQYDSYEMAGRVAAVGVVVWALQTVPTARLVDRWGQRKAMIPLTAMFVVGTTAGIVTAMTHGPEWALWVATAFASVSGPLGSLTRARWSHLLHDDKDIHTAFALEGSLDEILFIVGPALATILATVVWAPLGLIVATVSMLIGISILLSLKGTEPPPRKELGGESLGWRIPGAVAAVALIALGLGLVFGAFDLSTVAFADEFGHKAISGVLLGVISAGSLLGGLFYGARHWKTALWKRTVIGTSFVAAGFIVLSTAPNLIAFAVIGFFAGATIAPTLTNADTVVQRVVDRGQITEGLAWLRIGIGIGVAGGAWAAGYLIETQGARWGLLFAAASGMLTMLIAIAVIPLLKRGTDRESVEDVKAVSPVADRPIA